VTSSVAVFEAPGKINVYDKIMTETKQKTKKKKIWKSKKLFNINIHLKDGLGIEFITA